MHLEEQGVYCSKVVLSHGSRLPRSIFEKLNFIYQVHLKRENRHKIKYGFFRWLKTTHAASEKYIELAPTWSKASEDFEFTFRDTPTEKSNSESKQSLFDQNRLLRLKMKIEKSGSKSDKVSDLEASVESSADKNSVSSRGELTRAIKYMKRSVIRANWS